MKTLVFIIGVLAFSAKVQSAIVADEGDFVVDCGTDYLGMVSITYTNSDPATNNIAAMYSPKGRDTCSTSIVTASGEMVISDIRNNCDIIQPVSSKQEFWLQISLQEIADVYQQTDPTFLFKCSYSVGEVDVESSVINYVGNLGVPTFVVVDTKGDPDMGYDLKLIDPQTQAALTAAKFGDFVVLTVTMNGTDADENGVRVKSCTATSGNVSLAIIEDFCVVAGKEALFPLPGFVSSGTEAAFPMTVFALAGSTESTVQFQCVVDVCPSACDGLNCQLPGKRKKRASESEPNPAEEKVLTMVTRLQIIPGSPSGQLGRGNDNSPDTCTQSLAFIITVGVLAVLLLVAMVAVFFMFTARRRALQKQGA